MTKYYITIILLFLLYIRLEAEDYETIDYLITNAYEDLALGNYMEAIDKLDEAIRNQADNMSLYLSRAYAYHLLGKSKEALGDVYLALLINKNSYEAYYLSGLIKKDNKEYPAALRDFEKAIEINPEYHEAIIGRIDTYISMQNYDKAMSIVEESIKKHPTYGDLYFYKAKIFHYTQQYTTALENLDNALTFINDTDSSRFYLYRGEARLNLNQLLAARQDFDRALKINPNEIGAYYARGIIFYNLGMMDDALRDFNNALKILKTNKNSGVDQLKNTNFQLIGDSVEYDVIVKNPTEYDTYTSHCLKALKRSDMIEYIMNAVYNGKLKAYDYYTNEPMELYKIRELEDKYNRQSIGMVKFNEQWLFDKNNFTMEKRVYSVVLGYEVYSDTGEVKGYKPFFKIFLNQ